MFYLTPTSIPVTGRTITMNNGLCFCFSLIVLSQVMVSGGRLFLLKQGDEDEWCVQVKGHLNYRFLITCDTE